MSRAVGCAFVLLFLTVSPSAADEVLPSSWQAAAILGATSDYVFRGVSQRDHKPTPLAYVSLEYSLFYLEGFLVGVDLGQDVLGRNIGTVEADATIGINPRWGPVALNVGAKYTVYPNGRDIVVGSLFTAERDFIESFAGTTYSFSKQLSIGGTVYWTPDFYYESGEVRTLEGKVGFMLPQVGALNTKLTAFTGIVKSARPNVACPGNSYTYYNIGVEGQIDRTLFDVRYWRTDVDQLSAFEQRLVVSMGVSY